jgi:hypothetical protein
MRRWPAGAAVIPLIVIARPVRDSINAIWQRNNQHWNELPPGVSSTGGWMGPITQQEYMGCLVGRVSRDTVWVTTWETARNLEQRQFAVRGTCEHVRHLIGTFHTHPYRASPAGEALKEPVLSAGDFRLFDARGDRVILAAWDVDSIDGAIRAGDGTVVHPVEMLIANN